MKWLQLFTLLFGVLCTAHEVLIWRNLHLQGLSCYEFVTDSAMNNDL
jgi:hypothetical protein